MFHTLKRRLVVRLAIALSLGASGCTETPEASDPVPCYRGLADLDGDGVLNDADCELRGTGATVQQWCLGDPEAWIDNLACRGVKEGRAVFVTDPVAVHAIDYRGRALFVVESTTDAWTVYDYNRDGVPHSQGEQSTVGVTDPRVMAMGVLTPAYEAIVAFGSHLWRDRGHNGHVDNGELIALSLLTGTETIQDVAMSQSFRGHFVAAVSTTAGRIVAWADLDEDWSIDTGEVLEFAGSRMIGMDSAVVIFIDGSGVARSWESPDWTTPGVIRNFPVGDCHSRIQGSLFSGTYACYDAGGNAVFKQGDRITRPDLIAPGDIGFTRSAVALSRSTAFARLSVEDALDPSLWLDFSGNGDIGGREVISIDSVDSLNALQPSAVIDVDDRVVGLVTVHDPGRQMAMQTIFRSDKVKFLGERCGVEDVCAADLICRVSGEDPNTTCTMKPAP